LGRDIRHSKDSYAQDQGPYAAAHQRAAIPAPNRCGLEKWLPRRSNLRWPGATQWLAMLKCGKVKNLTEIAALEGVDNSYVSQMVNLTDPAPDIVEAILEGALPDHLTLFDLAVDPPADWEEQRVRFR